MAEADLSLHCCKPKLAQTAMGKRLRRLARCLQGVCRGLRLLRVQNSGARGGYILTVESDEFCQSVLQARWPAAAIWDNVLTFCGRPWRRLIDVFAAGFPKARLMGE